MNTQFSVVCLQLEVEFATLAELEQFWAKIPPQEHKAWSQRAQVLDAPGLLYSSCVRSFKIQPVVGSITAVPGIGMH